jgi:hypothetical protein
MIRKPLGLREDGQDTGTRSLLKRTWISMAWIAKDPLGRLTRLMK